MKAQTELPTVLVVDDEPDLRELIGDALRGEGVRVEAVGSGAEASAVIKSVSPDLVVTDLHLPDRRGTEIVDQIRSEAPATPTVVITGTGTADIASEVVKHGCVDFLTKPLDLPRLRKTIRTELSRARQNNQKQERQSKLRTLAKQLNRDRHAVQTRLNTTCEALTEAYRKLNQQFLNQESVIRFHRCLLSCRNDDDVFRNLFGLYAERGANLFGVAMVCDENADMQMIGRFGTPAPDTVSMCQSIGYSLLDLVLTDPSVLSVDPKNHPTLFPAWLRERLGGMSLLAVPLIPQEGQLIGLVVLYRKEGEVFDDQDIILSEMIAPSVAMCISGRGFAGDYQDLSE